MNNREITFIVKLRNEAGRIISELSSQFQGLAQQATNAARTANEAARAAEGATRPAVAKILGGSGTRTSGAGVRAAAAAAQATVAAAASGIGGSSLQNRAFLLGGRVPGYGGSAAGLAAAGSGSFLGNALAGAGNAALRGGAAAVGQLGQSLAGLTTQATTAGNAVATLAKIAAGVFVARTVAEYADQWNNLAGRLKLVTANADELRAVQQELYNVAQDTRAPLTETGELYGKLARATRDLGFSQQDLLGVTRVVAQTVSLSGASAESAKAGMLQFSQGMASGTLRGEELTSVLEQMPALAMAIADGMGVPFGYLRSLAGEGKLTTEVVMNAIKKMGPEIERQFANMPVTIGQAFTRLQNAAIKSVGEIDNRLKASQGVANFVSEFANILGSRGIQDIGAQVGSLVQLLSGPLGDGVLKVFGMLRDNAEASAAVISGALTAAFTLALIPAVKLAAVAVKALTVAMLANPYTAALVAIAAVAAAVYSLKDSVFQLGGVNTTVTAVFVSAWEWVSGRFTAIMNYIKVLSASVAENASQVWGGFADILVGAFSFDKEQIKRGVRAMFADQAVSAEEFKRRVKEAGGTAEEFGTILQRNSQGPLEEARRKLRELEVASYDLTKAGQRLNVLTPQQAEAIRDMTNDIDKRTAQLEMERKTLGMNEYQVQKLTATLELEAEARKKGVTDTKEFLALRERLQAATDQTVDAKQAYDISEAIRKNTLALALERDAMGRSAAMVEYLTEKQRLDEEVRLGRMSTTGRELVLRQLEAQQRSRGVQLTDDRIRQLFDEQRLLGLTGDDLVRMNEMLAIENDERTKNLRLTPELVRQRLAYAVATARANREDAGRKANQEYIAGLWEEVRLMGLVGDARVREQALIEIERINRSDNQRLINKEADARIRNAIAADQMRRTIETSTRMRDEAFDLETTVKALRLYGDELERFNLQRDIEKRRRAGEIISDDDAEAMLADLARLQRSRAETAADIQFNVAKAASTYLKETANVGEQVGQVFTNAMNGMADELATFITTGEADFGKFADSIIQQLMRIAVQQTILRPLLGMFGFAPAHNGAVVGQISASARTIPALAWAGAPRMHSGGAIGGLAANEVPIIARRGEAVLPLMRGTDGVLGVRSQGGGVTVAPSITINMTGGPSDAGQAQVVGAEIGRQVDAAMNAWAQRSLRPGGLMYAAGNGLKG